MKKRISSRPSFEIVPAGPTRECGFDRSMILAYGQDDRICAYTSLRAMLDTKKVDRHRLLHPR